MQINGALLGERLLADIAYQVLRIRVMLLAVTIKRSLLLVARFAARPIAYKRLLS